MEKNKPTLEEVKEYFKNVAEIEGLYIGVKYLIDTERLGVFRDGNLFRQGEDDNHYEVILYDPEFGYAKITKYKDPTNQQKTAGETLTKGKHQAKLIWNNINHTEIINFDTYDTKSSHSIEFYFIDEDKGEIPITRINTELVSVIILK